MLQEDVARLEEMLREVVEDRDQHKKDGAGAAGRIEKMLAVIRDNVAHRQAAGAQVREAPCRPGSRANRSLF